MPYKGSMPKEEDQRVNRIPKKYDKTVIETDAEVVVRGPDLPGSTDPNGRPWTERTKEFWYKWRTSPQSKLMGELDWEFMLEVAVMHNEYWSPPRVINGEYKPALSATSRANYAAEMRQRVAKFGATHEDRAKLQMQIDVPHTAESEDKQIEAEAKSAIDYAERLAKKAAEVKE